MQPCSSKRPKHEPDVLFEPDALQVQILGDSGHTPEKDLELLGWGTFVH